jgi:hypothetical protein
MNWHHVQDDNCYYEGKDGRYLQNAIHCFHLGIRIFKLNSISLIFIVLLIDPLIIIPLFWLFMRMLPIRSEYIRREQLPLLVNGLTD